MKRRQVGLSLDGETIVLHKFHGDFARPSYADDTWFAQNSELLARGAGLDTETTGLRFSESKIIEIAIRPFIYRKDTGAMLIVEEGYTGLEDPMEPLSEQLREVTGLTDEMLSGQAIDWNRVHEILSSVQMVIAHNAKFDRPFIDRSVPTFKDKVWGCSLSQVDWGAKGFGIQKLEILAHYHGFFVDAHRAMNDVNAMLNLLSMPDDKTGRAYLKELADASARPAVVIYAERSPFESKDVLKASGYRWDNQRRTWFRTVYEDQLENEIKWLEETVYVGRFGGTTKLIPVTRNFAYEE